MSRHCLDTSAYIQFRRGDPQTAAAIDGASWVGFPVIAPGGELRAAGTPLPPNDILWQLVPGSLPISTKCWFPGRGPIPYAPQTVIRFPSQVLSSRKILRPQL